MVRCLAPEDLLGSLSLAPVGVGAFQKVSQEELWVKQSRILRVLGRPLQEDEGYAPAPALSHQPLPSRTPAPVHLDFSLGP